MRNSANVHKMSLMLLVVLITLQVCQCSERGYGEGAGRGREVITAQEEVLMQPRKRPFCNAFTGCGRKRSGGAPGMPLPELERQRQMAEHDTLNSLLDLSPGEPAVEDLSRQILSEAKMWEAIQDASAEIYRRKTGVYPLAYNAQ